MRRAGSSLSPKLHLVVIEAISVPFPQGAGRRRTPSGASAFARRAQLYPPLRPAPQREGSQTPEPWREVPPMHRRLPKSSASQPRARPRQSGGKHLLAPPSSHPGAPQSSRMDGAPGGGSGPLGVTLASEMKAPPPPLPTTHSTSSLVPVSHFFALFTVPS